MERTDIYYERQEPQRPLSMHPLKFATWLFIVSIVMIFAALTSAYVVRKAEGNWLEFNLPDMFYYTSGLILLSSVSMHMAYLSLKNDLFDRAKIFMAITIILGVVFCYGQFIAWGELVNNDIYFVGNPAGSFVYVFSGLHGVHIVSGIVFLIIVIINIFRSKIHSRNMAQMEMCTTFWHFLGGLWLYLFAFLIFNN
jgi:cytochrome c oxidase subunit III